MSIEEKKLDALRHVVQKNEELLCRMRREEAVLRIYAPRAAPHGVGPDALLDLYDFVAKSVGDVPLLYLEFGVAGGKSMRYMAERFKHPKARFVGFDTFEGLPEDWHDKPKGSFSMQGKMPSIPDKRVSFVKGLFQDSLPPFLKKLKHRGPVLVHYDPDLYSSTLFVLCTLWYSLPDYYFIFDEFMSEEVMALDDFSRGFPVDLEFLSQTNEGGFPPRVFGKLRRKPSGVTAGMGHGRP